MRNAPDAGVLLTFTQFAAISLYHLPNFICLNPSTHLPQLKSRQVPLYDWAFIVCGFITVNILNNLAFKFSIPLPIHMVFRCSGLCISMLLGWVVLNKRYTLIQVICVVIVTAGTILTTLYSPYPSAKEYNYTSNLEYSDYTDYANYMAGISLLSLALLLSSLMGASQEKIYAKYGSHTWPEMLFYTHILAIPLIPLFLPALIPQLKNFHRSGRVGVSGLGVNVDIPHMYLLLLANVISQLICITGVNKLTAVS